MHYDRGLRIHRNHNTLNSLRRTNLKPSLALQLSISVLIVLLCFVSINAPSTKGNITNSLEAASSSINQAFNNTLIAEDLGADVTSLLNRLSSAGELLSQAEIYSRTNNTSNITNLAENSKLQAEQTNKEAIKLQAEAIAKSQITFLQIIFISVGGGAFFAIILILVWRRFKTSQIQNNIKISSVTNKQLDKYRRTFFVITLVGILLFALPVIGYFVKLPTGQSFSELYILGPDKSLERIPFNIKNNEEYHVYLGVGNKLGYSSYYIVYVKLGPQHNSLTDQFSSPSTLPTLYEYRLFLKNEERSLAPLIFKINDSGLTDGTYFLPRIVFNGIEFPINQASNWNPVKTGYYYDLIIELWMYNASTQNPQYTNRFVSLTLNMTSENA